MCIRDSVNSIRVQEKYAFCTRTLQSFKRTRVSSDLHFLRTSHRHRSRTDMACNAQRQRSFRDLKLWKPVSYTHLDVYKRQV